MAEEVRHAVLGANAEDPCNFFSRHQEDDGIRLLWRDPVDRMGMLQPDGFRS